MGLYQNLYFTSLVGAIAGLGAWALQSAFAFLVPVQSNQGIPILTASVLLGALICGLTVFFGDKWSGNRIQGRWIASGVGLGVIGGLIAGLVQMPLRDALPKQPLLAVVIGWMVAGALIGIAVGTRWAGINRMRITYGLVGGMAGGFFGGIVFALLGDAIPDVSQALAYVLTGCGISFGIAFAPILLRDATLHFLSSGDPRAAAVLKKRTPWEIHDGDSYLLGSEESSASTTKYGPGVDIYVKDLQVAPRHARLFGKGGRFFITRHPDLMSEAALRRFVLRVQDRSVTAPRELQHQDVILIGLTTFQFLTKRGQSQVR